MVDYDKASGQGTLRIRDLGSTIEFWVHPYYSDFWWQNLDFNWTANGATTPKQWDFNGNSWQKIGAVTVTTSQTVTFRLLEATNTQSLGGPTTHSVAISRGTVPQAPDPVTFSSVTATTLTASFTDNGNGGVAIDSRQIGYAVGQPSGPTTIVASDGSTAITGLTSGVQYSFWARTHNARGYSPWSSRTLITTLRVPFPPSTPDISEITQISAKVHFNSNANGGAAIDLKEIGFGLSNIAPQFTVALDTPTSFYTNTLVLTDLNPGEEYFFWAREHNFVGWSDWSQTPGLAVLVAGSWIKVGAVWKRAVPYVKVGGVWKVARPWVRYAGNWKETT